MVNLHLSFVSNMEGIHHILIGNSIHKTFPINMQHYQDDFQLNQKEANIQIYNRSPIPMETHKNILKRVIAKITLFFILALSSPEKYNCPYLYEKELRLIISGNNPELNIQVIQEADFPPIIVVSSKNCRTIEEKTRYSINKQELNQEYKERSIALNSIGCTSIFLCLLLTGWGVILSNYVTALFAGVIVLIFLFCFLFAKYSLKKRWKQLNKFVEE